MRFHAADAPVPHRRGAAYTENKGGRENPWAGRSGGGKNRPRAAGTAFPVEQPAHFL